MRPDVLQELQRHDVKCAGSMRRLMRKPKAFRRMRWVSTFIQMNGANHLPPVCQFKPGCRHHRTASVWPLWISHDVLVLDAAHPAHCAADSQDTFIANCSA